MSDVLSWAGSNSFFFRLTGYSEEEIIRLTHQLIGDGFVVEAAGENWLLFVRLEVYGAEKLTEERRAGFAKFKEMTDG